MTEALASPEATVNDSCSSAGLSSVDERTLEKPSPSTALADTDSTATGTAMRLSMAAEWVEGRLLISSNE